ncbi:MAG: haloalkane dehalogenase [Desulfobacteraceae bacterium]|nr:MAG: haloalkane dehalogenase [Desulfobacteraceae bacterium]
MISSEELPKQFIEVDGLRMAYHEVGTGTPIVFQHGNPTSSYLWRNVIPHVKHLGRCIAIDLIGMGDSDKLPDSGPGRYTFTEHRKYLDAALSRLGVSHDVTWVVHDWGSSLGFDWANRHRDAVRGICYMEAIVQPFSWADWPEAPRRIFQGFRSPAGEEMVLEKNIFVERVLPSSILRSLTNQEMDVYRRPYTQSGESRRPTLTWPRQLPIDGMPEDVVEIVRSYADWLSRSDAPKLFIDAEPGAILTGRPREFCRTWPNQSEVRVKGIHFVQEDSPDEIGKTIADWLAGID